MCFNIKQSNNQS